MKICVVTPYFETPEHWLRQCCASVRSQSVEAHHILVCDGTQPAQMPDFHGSHIILQRNFQDYGNTPRLIGCYQAMAMGADAIAFLDADNWFYRDHLEDLSRFASQHLLEAVCSSRMLHRLDGTTMIKCPTVDGRHFIDTNCLFVLRPAFPHLIAWAAQPLSEAAVSDQRVWQHMAASGIRLGFRDRPTVAYRTRHAVHYAQAGEAPPHGAVNRTDHHGERYH
jgi:hypothetical protein